MALLQSFAPIVDAECRVLELGTMPGTVSLQRNQYYAHERNRFWRVMESLVGVPANAPYEDRLVGLRSAGIALWDTLKHCERGGSLDAKIRNAEPNDFGGFLEQYPSICVIALNGRKAAEVFRRRIYPGLPVKIAGRLAVLELPSTSPANARGGLEALLEDWGRLEDWVRKPRA